LGSRFCDACEFTATEVFDVRRQMDERLLEREVDLGAQAQALSIRQAAAAAGMSERAIRRAIDRGELSASKTGGVFQVSPDELARYQALQPGQSLPRPRLLRLVSPTSPAFADGRVPLLLTPLIGREREVAIIQDFLEQPEVRLVTLTGPGGVGKTRLALAVANELGKRFADGAAFVSLAPVRQAVLVSSAIAQALGVRETGDLPLVERIATFLKERELLLVLDNFEHVVDAGPLVAVLLATCAGLHVLVTSRERLHLSGEQDVPVPPLAVPGVEESRSQGVEEEPARRGGRREAGGGRREIEDSAAVQLFMARARAIDPDFALTQENAAAVAAVCRRLDGLPLALELAAARIAVLPPAALLARLDRRLPLLTGGPRDLPARLRTMRDAIAWSYDLLSPEERTLFRRLSVFVGGFTLEAAEWVSDGKAESGRRAAGEVTVTRSLPPRDSDTSTPSSDILNLVSSLVDKSLLQRLKWSDREPRFAMLETIREYGLERLQRLGEAENAQRRHAEYFLDFAATEETKLRGHEQAAVLTRLEMEHDNLRAALSWSLAAPNRVETAVRLAGALHWFWYLRGHFSEGRRWLEEALARSAALDFGQSRVKAQTAAGLLAMHQNDNAAARVHLQESVALARMLRDTTGVAYALHVLAWGDPLQADPSKLLSQAEESVALFRETGDQWGLASALCTLGMVRIANLRIEDAIAPIAESLALARDLGDTWGLARALHYSGELARHHREDEQARALYEESLALYRRLDHQFSAAAVLHNLGYVAQHQDNPRRGLEYVSEALAEQLKHGNRPNIALCLGGLAGMVSLLGQPEPAARLFGAAATLFEVTRTSIWPVDRIDYDRNLSAVRAQLGEDLFANAFAAGRAMSLEQAIAEAFAITDAIRLKTETSIAGSDEQEAIAPEALGLTAREREVLDLVSRRATDREIADALSISPRTVEHHVSHILAKLGLSTRRDAAAWAAEHLTT
jgi:predicted ATPase/DNA-binding CsgD family transcriptional regulator